MEAQLFSCFLQKVTKKEMLQEENEKTLNLDPEASQRFELQAGAKDFEGAAMEAEEPLAAVNSMLQFPDQASLALTTSRVWFSCFTVQKASCTLLLTCVYGIV